MRIRQERRDEFSINDLTARQFTIYEASLPVQWLQPAEARSPANTGDTGTLSEGADVGVHAMYESEYDALLLHFPQASF